MCLTNISGSFTSNNVSMPLKDEIKPLYLERDFTNGGRGRNRVNGYFIECDPCKPTKLRDKVSRLTCDQQSQTIKQTPEPCHPCAGTNLKDSETVLVQLQRSNDNLGGVKTNRGRSTVDLLTDDTLDLNDPLAAVDGGDLALLALLGTTDNEDLVVLADGHGADTVLLTELLGEGSRHEGAADGGGSGEVGLAALAAGGGDV
ncbi:hypothetical protein G7K_5728-t1 [Saitoella complicata NRRL Y-17804]|uniref:Uncharacterized protein n=1 Tax=Saitoella complicata (strain BCRC 22490 / CBS 7301 / JCM 7358 / NBRC 10748 / NRRL Y-17804) TaxID=698492 RepID=A0A0E9NP24_SAICN|nr:hypothetical protein G7K_5728-t1 [Saitoella complicata NRRL Y-17804]